jgi:hypothetical protein
MSQSFHVKYEPFLLTGSRGKQFSMTLPNFCIFYDYLPFEEDIALYLKNLEFPLVLPKD